MHSELSGLSRLAFRQNKQPARDKGEDRGLGGGSLRVYMHWGTP